MMGQDETKNGAEVKSELEVLDPALKQALNDFKASVHAWSEAGLSRPRTVSAAVVRRTWRMAAGWALALALVAGAVSGGFYERHHQQELARIATARIAEQQRELAAAQARAKAEDDLLAKVDSDVSQEVPDALEPLAELSAQSTAK
jgi:hypothetical protein